MAKYALDYICYIPLVLMTCKQVSNHLHHFIGPSKINPGLTYNDVRSSRCTTAEITDDMSAYWSPSMYHITKKDKLVSLESTGTSVYWFGITGENEMLTDMPGGLR
jgi:hypothetical protein